jgi:outer membrane immunogenic protein
MKKLSIIILFSAITLTTAYSQSPLGNGNHQLNAGVGFSDWGIPVYFGMDFGVHKDITLGFEASLRNNKEYYDNSNYHSPIFGLLGNFNYHFNTILEIPSNWDFYAGINIGYFFWSSSSDYPGNGSSGLGLGAQIGGRYFFKKNFGLNLELGGGNSYSGGKFGITYIF